MEKGTGQSVRWIMQSRKYPLKEKGFSAKFNLQLFLSLTILFHSCVDSTKYFIVCI